MCSILWLLLPLVGAILGYLLGSSGAPDTKKYDIAAKKQEKIARFFCLFLQFPAVFTSIFNAFIFGILTKIW